jgi:hypothetical protein
MKAGYLNIILIALALATMPARAQRAQVLSEQARTFGQISKSPVSREGGDFVAEVIPATEEARRLTLSGSAEGGLFYTDNALFADRGRKSDRFFAATAGVGARYALAPQWEADASVRGGLFRFDRFGILDFQSLDISVGMTFVPATSRGTAFYARYTFTELLAHHTRDVFYTNHAITFGAQHSIPFSRAHGLTLGAAAQWAWADPADAQRDDYSLYAGYRLRIARALTADVLYRLNWFVYREGADGRRDLRNSISLSLRYELTEWLALTAMASYVINESNRDGDFRVGSVGANLGLQYQF